MLPTLFLSFLMAVKDIIYKNQKSEVVFMNAENEKNNENIDIAPKFSLINEKTKRQKFRSNESLNISLLSEKQKKQAKFNRQAENVKYLAKKLIEKTEMLGRRDVQYDNEKNMALKEILGIKKDLENMITTTNEIELLLKSDDRSNQGYNKETELSQEGGKIQMEYLPDYKMIKYIIAGGLPHRIKDGKNGTYSYMYDREKLTAEYIAAVKDFQSIASDIKDLNINNNKALLYIINHYPEGSMSDHDNLDIKPFIDTMVKLPFLRDDSPDNLSIWMDYKESEDNKGRYMTAYLGEWQNIVNIISSKCSLC